MESTKAPDPDLAALGAAERARDDLARSVQLPPWHDVVIGTASAVFVAGVSVFFAVDRAWAFAGACGAALLWHAVAAGEIYRFRRLNRVRLPGFGFRAVYGNTRIGIIGWIATMAAAWAAAEHRLWWLVGAVAVTGGLVHVLAERQWLERYRQHPTRSSSWDRRWLRLLLALTVVAFVLAFVGTFLAADKG